MQNLGVYYKGEFIRDKKSLENKLKKDKITRGKRIKVLSKLNS